MKRKATLKLPPVLTVSYTPCVGCIMSGLQSCTVQQNTKCLLIIITSLWDGEDAATMIREFNDNALHSYVKTVFGHEEILA